MAENAYWILPLAFVGLMAAFVGLLRWFGRSTTKRLEESSDLAESGEAAQAEILSLKETGTRINQRPLVAIRAKVTCAGQPPYEAAFEAVVSVTVAAQVQPGCTVPVAVDPANPSRVALKHLE
jgi:hypothetical protein